MWQQEAGHAVASPFNQHEPECISMIIDYSNITTGELSVSGNNSIWIDGVMARFSHFKRIWKNISRDKAIEIANRKDEPAVVNSNTPTLEDRVSETRRLSITNVIVNLDSLRETAKIMDESVVKTKASEYK